jgi:hypothetical protein
MTSARESESIARQKYVRMLVSRRISHVASSKLCMARVQQPHHNRRIAAEPSLLTTESIAAASTSPQSA